MQSSAFGAGTLPSKHVTMVLELEDGIVRASENRVVRRKMERDIYMFSD